MLSSPLEDHFERGLRLDLAWEVATSPAATKPPQKRRRPSRVTCFCFRSHLNSSFLPSATRVTTTIPAIPARVTNSTRTASGFI